MTPQYGQGNGFAGVANQEVALRIHLKQNLNLTVWDASPRRRAQY